MRTPHRDDPRDPWGEYAGEMYQPRFDSAAQPDATETENPVVATLLGPDGSPIRQWRERPPIGYRRNADRRRP